GTDAGGTNGWQMVKGGDGGYVAIDPTNPQIMYAEYVGGTIAKSTNGGQPNSFVDIQNGLNDNNFMFITPFVIDTLNPQTLWIGGNTIWRTIDGGANWVQASTVGGARVS